MGTLTNFQLTATPGTAVGNEDGTQTIRNASATQRFAAAGVSGTYSYPDNGNLHDIDGFSSPKMRFKFLNAYGQAAPSSPTINLRVPSLLNITSFSDYSRTENIFSNGADFRSIYGGVIAEKTSKIPAGGAVADAITSIGEAGVSGIEALQYVIRKGLSSTLGFVGSAGLSGIGQYEYSNRQAINPMAQMLYKGPQFRKYQIPVVIRPASVTEKNAVRSIIAAFRIASSPSIPSTAALNIGDVTIGEGNAFTFGYPYLTEFSIKFGGGSDEIFKSKPCVIESVSVDYGGGQKMTFFEDGTPSEMNLTLQLTEVMPRTLGDAIIDANSQNMKIL